MGQVHCLEAGSGPGAPLVLLHQTPRSVDEFAEVIPLLAPSRPVLAVDTPGYGSSDPVPGQPTIEGYARAVAAALDGLGVDRFIPVGHHTGAVVAVELAAAQAERVEKVVLSGPVFADEAGRAALRPLFKQWHVQADGTHLMEKWGKLTRWTADPVLLQRLVVDVFRAGETSEQGHLAVAEYRMEDRLPFVRCPALLVRGREDPFCDAGQNRRFHPYFSPCTEVDLPGGVFLLHESPEAFARAVLDFV
jgi:pimeloyl-ACP methyl ester carboxylesterase